jgi:hypothetical protein
MRVRLAISPRSNPIWKAVFLLKQSMSRYHSNLTSISTVARGFRDGLLAIGGLLLWESMLELKKPTQNDSINERRSNAKSLLGSWVLSWFRRCDLPHPEMPYRPMMVDLLDAEVDMIVGTTQFVR